MIIELIFVVDVDVDEGSTGSNRALLFWQRVLGGQLSH